MLCLADFIATGPPQVLFSTLARIFPVSVAGAGIFGMFCWATYLHYSWMFWCTASAAVVVIAIPTAFIGARLVSKSKKYYTFTIGGYTFGCKTNDLVRFHLQLGFLCSCLLGPGCNRVGYQHAWVWCFLSYLWLVCAARFNRVADRRVRVESRICVWWRVQSGRQHRGGRPIAYQCVFLHLHPCDPTREIRGWTGKLSLWFLVSCLVFRSPEGNSLFTSALFSCSWQSWLLQASSRKQSIKEWKQKTELLSCMTKAWRRPSKKWQGLKFSRKIIGEESITRMCS